MSLSILIIKTSSMGDVIHCLPVIADIKTHHPQARIDWLVEKPFADMPEKHPHIRKVIHCNVRAWRKRPFAKQTRDEYHAMLNALSPQYDAVIDCQGLLKSTWLMRKTVGKRHGYDWGSVRERFASLAYDVKHSVPKQQHAVDRNRQLVAAALNYPLSEAFDYGLPRTSNTLPYVYCIHATSKDRKLWPEANWIALIAALEGLGYQAILPWGNASEEARAKRLAAANKARVLPRMSVAALAERMPQAALAIGVDTGLLHLAAALGLPCVGIYVSSDPIRAGAKGGIEKCINLGGLAECPSLEVVLSAAQQLLPPL